MTGILYSVMANDEQEEAKYCFDLKENFPRPVSQSGISWLVFSTIGTCSVRNLFATWVVVWSAGCSLKMFARIKSFLKDNLFVILTIFAVVIGIGLGILLQRTNPSREVLLWVGIPGDLFIRLLTLMVIPLIAATIINVTSTLDPKENGKISAVTFAFITTSNFTAAICGAVACLILKPGQLTAKNVSNSKKYFMMENSVQTSDIFVDMLYNLFPDNLVGVPLFQAQTAYNNPGNLTGRTVKKIDSVNMLGLLFCCFAFGIAAGTTGEKGKPFLDFFKSLSDIVFKIMNLFLKFTPLGVCFMIAGPIASAKDLASTFSQLGLFMVTVLVGLLIHLVIIFGVYVIFTRKNPFRLLPYTFKTWLISITTLAPVVAIPDMYDASDRFGIDLQLSRFVVPLTAALKGDGSATFLAASALFIAQLTDTPITAAMVVIIILLSGSAVFTIPNIPSSSLIILVTILSSLGVPVNYVGLLFVIDWLM
ncbi:unnamed protein product [Hymenolepis diminuta]|uniref:Amino acid transporter n=1 Tax=Hymenolepis diminuta TaxID=6216 RepID=A0A0R3SAN1_HYMDI|nr:unnamed protein product [Hymenolepis diminuta]